MGEMVNQRGGPLENRLAALERILAGMSQHQIGSVGSDGSVRAITVLAKSRGGVIGSGASHSFLVETVKPKSGGLQARVYPGSLAVIFTKMQATKNEETGTLLDINFEVVGLVFFTPKVGSEPLTEPRLLGVSAADFVCLEWKTRYSAGTELTKIEVDPDSVRVVATSSPSWGSMPGTHQWKLAQINADGPPTTIWGSDVPWQQVLFDQGGTQIP